MQPDFAAAVLAGCQAEGIHTCIETTRRHVLATRSRACVKHTDLVLYDLKLMDDAAHRRWVGASNRQILANAARLRRAQRPGARAADPRHHRHGRQPARHLRLHAPERPAARGAPALQPVRGAKYEWLGEEYTVAGETQKKDALERMVSMARDAGLDAEVG